MSESLAIIGISCLFPKADDLQAYWRNIRGGVDAITPIPERSHWKVADYFTPDPKAPDRTYAQRGGFIPPVDFNPMEFGMAPKDIEATDTTQLLGMVAARQALVDAGYGDKPFPKERTSVILGVTGALELVIPLGARLGHPLWRRALKEAGVAEDVAEDVVQRISDGYVGWQENSFPGLLGNVAAGRIASRLDLGGTNCVVDAACASSLAALHLAALELDSGRSDLVITGGIDTFNDIFMYMCFSKTPALSPTGDAKPFDRSCDGTILGEGLGMLVLKRLADAERDGDRIYAVLTGIGSASDGRGNAIYAPRSEGQQLALRRAYAEAGVSPTTVELVEAHGTGTKVGDATELRSLLEVYREAQPDGTWAALGSVKSQIGHTKAAAGVAGLIKAALALHHKVLPPTIKVSQPMEEIAPGRSPFYVNTQPRPWLARAEHPRRAGVSSFGFGGTNFHCVMEEHGARKERPSWDGDVEILAFSADTRAALREQLAALPAELPWLELRARAVQSRKAFDPAAGFRLLMPVARENGLGALRDAALGTLDKQPEKTAWTLPNGTAFGSGACRGKLGALFPGQGSQYVGMFRDLACQFPEFLDVLGEADRVFGRERGEAAAPRLSDFIYPHPAFAEEERQRQEAALKSTDVAQPALGAMGLGALGVANYFGLRPEAAAGHSYGELLALCGAGRLATEQLHQLSNLRGRLMASRNGNGDRGAMLAVSATEEVVAGLLREEKLDLVIANRNSPSQFVVAGAKAEIEKAAGLLEKKSVRARVLPVSAAFHSPLVADARAPFAEALARVSFGAGTMPVYANSTAQAYPADEAEAREVLAGQIVKPVNFKEQIEAMHADGVTTFIELGPGHVLSDLAQAILAGKEVATVALDASKGKRGGAFDLAVFLCRVAALGHTVQLTRWEAPMAATAKSGKPALTISLSGSNYRSPSRPRPAVAPTPPVRVAATNISTPLAEPKAPAYPKAAPQTAGGNAALQAAQQGILALQKMQEETARLHRQFLEHQEASRRTLEQLLNQRRELLGMPAVPVAPVAPVAAPAMVPPPTPVVQTSRSRGNEALIAQKDNEPHHVGSYSVNVARASEVLLSVVAEKTGYPVEMLNLDMGMDSDLGVDSIKRVEIMAAVRGQLPEAPEVKPEHLGTLQTLRQVVDFLTAGQTGSSRGYEALTSQKNSEPPHVVSYGVNVARASEVLLSVVAEKTGYPVEMLNLDMGMDSDLGVDSIKRVEIMAAVRGQLPEAPEVKPEHLGTLQTLRQVVDFLTAGQTGSSRGYEALTSQKNSEPPHVVSYGVNVARASEVLLSVVAEKTGYPVEMLNLDMGMDSDLGVDSIKRVEIMAAVRGQLPEAPEVKPEHLGTLQTLRQVVEFLTADAGSTGSCRKKDAPCGTSAVLPPSTFAKPTADRKGGTTNTNNQALNRQVVRPVSFNGTDTRDTIKLPAGAGLWITDDGSELPAQIAERLGALGYQTRRGSAAELQSLKESPAALVILWPAARGGDEDLKAAFRLVQAAGPSLRQQRGVLVTVSRLDGVFGFGALNGNGDPVSGGLAGIAKTAWHEWPEVHCKAIDLDAENGHGPEAAEFIVEEMFRAGPVEVGISQSRRYGLAVETEPLAGGDAALDLQPRDVVVVTGGARGITALAALQLARRHRAQLVLLGRSELPEREPDWLAGVSGEAELKRALAAHGNGNGKISPKQLESRYREVMAQREIRGHLREIAATGAAVHYRTADVRDAAALAGLFVEIRRDLGPVRGLVHGAGVLADRRIEDKTGEQFDLVYGTKVDGLRNLLQAVADDELKLLALFASYTGRFGRTGQVDYAAANEVLNKIAQSEARRRPGCRVVSFNWGPWNGGMVTPGLRKIFEAEGVGLIEPEAGAEFFAREIAADRRQPVEVLVLARANGAAPAEPEPPAPAAGDGAFSAVLAREVSINTTPILAAHVFNGRAVLPAALMLEWLAQGAVHDHPGLAFHGCENFKVLKGLVLEPGAAAPARVLAAPGEWSDGLLRVPVQLVSGPAERPVRHAQAEVLLAETLPAAPAEIQAQMANPAAAPYAYGDGQLFHGTELRGIEAVESNDAAGIAARVKSPPAPRQWLAQPWRANWLGDPLALDCAFQLMILWTWQQRGAASLPCAIRRFQQFAEFPKTGGSRIEILVAPGDAPVIAAELRFFDRAGRLLACAEGYECVVDAGLKDAFGRNHLPA